MTGNLKTLHGGALPPAERGEHAQRQQGGDNNPLTKPRPEGLLKTEIGSPHARITIEPMVVQSCLRGPVTFVTSALLSYRNRLLGASPKRGTRLRQILLRLMDYLPRFTSAGATDSPRARACHPEACRPGTAKDFQDFVAAYFQRPCGTGRASRCTRLVQG